MSEPCASYCHVDIKSLNYNNRNVMSIKPTHASTYICLSWVSEEKSLHNINISLSVKIDPNEPFPFHLLSDSRQ